MPAQYNNMEELNAYLTSLENRIRTLEGQNDSLQKYVTDLGGDAQKMLPKTSLLSTSFIQRAFAVWGHYFVAQLCIAIPLLCIYFIFIFVVLQNSVHLISTPIP